MVCGSECVRVRLAGRHITLLVAIHMIDWMKSYLVMFIDLGNV